MAVVGWVLMRMRGVTRPVRAAQHSMAVVGSFRLVSFEDEGLFEADEGCAAQEGNGQDLPPKLSPWLPNLQAAITIILPRVVKKMSAQTSDCHHTQNALSPE